MKEEEKKQPFYKSTKKTLGVIGFIFYWGLQIPAVINDPTVAVELTLENGIFVASLLGIKVVSALVNKKKESL